jgi:hypothetical protein
MPYVYTFTKELEQFGLCSFKLNLTDSDSILPELNIPVIFKHEEHTEEAMAELALRIIAEQVQLEEDRKIAVQLELERLAAEKLEAERIAAERETIIENLLALETIVEELSATETTMEESYSTIEEQF